MLKSSLAVLESNRPFHAEASLGARRALWLALALSCAAAACNRDRTDGDNAFRTTDPPVPVNQNDVSTLDASTTTTNGTSADGTGGAPASTGDGSAGTSASRLAQGGSGGASGNGGSAGKNSNPHR